MNQAINSLTIQTASQLAASGNYHAASTLLDTIQADEIPIAVYLLRAKIFAQQGNYAAAIVQWQNVLEKDPENQEAQAGIRKAEQLKSRSAGKPYRRRKILYAFFLFLFLGLVGVFLFSFGHKITSSFSRDTELTKEVLTIQSQQSQQIREIDEKLRSLIAKSEMPPDIKINIPGILQTIEDNTIILTFENGLFQGGTNKLKPGELPRLSSLAQQLETYVGNISIRVTGHADDTPLPAGSEYRDNESLGFARAVAVIEQLRRTAQLPSGIFSAISAGESLPPYPNDLQENRERNRTVVIRISSSIK